MFKTIIPIATMQANYETKRILDFCTIPRKIGEIQEFMKLSNRDYFRKSILNPLIKGGLLKLTIPNKPTSPNQKYYS